MITLTFRPVIGESPVSVRGTYFRICADATLRGPDNAIAASYSEGLWQLGRRRHRSFECSGAFYLRVMHWDGSYQRTGPYDFVKAVDGALFTQTDFLVSFAPAPHEVTPPQRWHEIALLPPAD